MLSNFRFPERQKDRFRDPNYDPRYDTDDPKAPGVLGGWLPELQGKFNHLMDCTYVRNRYKRMIKRL